MPVEFGDVGAGAGLVALVVPHGPAPGGEVGPARAAGGLRVRRDHLHAGLDEVGPVVDALRVAAAGRRTGWSTSKGGGFCRRSRHFGSSRPLSRAIASISGCSARVTTSASSPLITALACAPEPPFEVRISTVWPVGPSRPRRRAGSGPQTARAWGRRRRSAAGSARPPGARRRRGRAGRRGTQHGRHSFVLRGGLRSAYPGARLQGFR